MRYHLSEIARLCGGEFFGVNLEACEVVVDSRNHAFGGGAMFVAIRGHNCDAHDFVGQMYDRGVRAFMVEQEIDWSQYPNTGVVRVECALEALQRLAAEHRRAFGGVLEEGSSAQGKPGAKARPEGVVDAHTVEIP